ncbi:hypothetical protein, partial [Lichenibacterium ramalinae]|uniref:hypothetical protein n=1 Tax=Lichenibacterium ramalinae TaxID=2316527 RepID=UPI001A919949
GEVVAMGHGEMPDSVGARPLSKICAARGRRSNPPRKSRKIPIDVLERTSTLVHNISVNER